MFGSTALFELRYQLRNPVCWVALVIFFLLTFGATASESIQIGGGGNVKVNAPFAILQTQLILTLFFMFVTTAFVANVVVRDDDSGFEEGEEVCAVLEEGGVVEDFLSIARAREVDFHDLADAGFRAVRHHHAAVGHEDGFVDVVCDNHGGELLAGEDVDDDVLKFHPGEGIEAAERFI